MEILTLNGKRYVKASKAAKDFGYATDYVGQLCRTGAVDAHLVGRTWYVNPDVLGAHRVEKKRNARAKAREYAKKSIEESRSLTVKQDTKDFKNIAIRYNGDESELIPEVSKKINVISEKRITPPNTDDSADRYTILNKNNKIIMSGTIPVYDVEEETQLTDIVILKPRIVRKDPKKTVPEDYSDESRDVEVGHEPQSEARITRPSFADRLVQEVENSPVSAELPPDVSESGIVLDERRVTSKWYDSALIFYGILLLIVLIPFSLLFENEIIYTSGSVMESFTIDFSFIELIFSN